MNKFTNKKDTKKIFLKLKLKLDTSEETSRSEGEIAENSIKYGQLVSNVSNTVAQNIVSRSF